MCGPQQNGKWMLAGKLRAGHARPLQGSRFVFVPQGRKLHHIFYLLSIIYYLLSIIYYLLSFIFYLLSFIFIHAPSVAAMTALIVCIRFSAS